MNEQLVKSAHWSFWFICIFAFIWHALGGVNFLVQLNPEMVAKFPESHRAIIEGRPIWATAGFAVAVFGGAIASLLLLLKKSIAFYVYLVSLLGVIMTMIHTIIIANSVIAFTVVEIIVMILLPTAVLILLSWYARYAQSKAWLK